MNHRHRPSTVRRFALKPLPLALMLMTATAAPAMAQGFTGLGSTHNVSIQQGTAANGGQLATVTLHGKAGYAQTDGFGLGTLDALRVIDTRGSHFLVQVTGHGASQINGQISALGNVWISNPNGVLIGQHATIDTGGFMGTTLAISREDFLSGRYQFSATPGQGPMAGRVINKGRITAHGGDIVLSGQQVTNEGTLQAQGGRVGLLAADEVLVDVEGDGLLFFNVKASDAQVRVQQLGQIQADGGSVEVMAAARGRFADTVLNMDGIIQARTLGTRHGQVVIDGGPSGATVVSGTVDVSGQQAGQTGGSAAILGEKVALVGQAHVDARGDAGGGQILVGGDMQGTGTARRASRTYVGQDVLLDASALSLGDGGRVIVWADGHTRFLGELLARGGTLGGNGGFAEVSGHEHLDYLGSADLSAPLGLKGNLLLDPQTIEIVSSAALADKDGNGTAGDDMATGDDSDAGAGFLFTATSSAGTSKISADAIETQLATANVTLQASDDILVNAEIDASLAPGAPRSLTLTAGTSAFDTIVLGANIKTRGGITLNATGGGIELAADVTLDGGSGQVKLDGALDGQGHALTLTSASAATDAIHLVGDTVDVSALTLDGIARLSGTIGKGSGAGTGTVSATGAVTLEKTVSTTGNQTWSSTVTLAGTGTRTLTSSTGNISLNGVAGAGRSLTLNATAGTASLNGAVTNTAILTTTGSATTEINANVTAEAQTYGDVVLGGAASTVTLSGETITLQDVGSTTGRGLVVNATTASKALTDPTNLGTVTFNGTVSSGVASLNTTGSAKTVLNAGATGINADTQTYGSASLGGDTVLNGAQVTLAKVDGGSGHDLTVSSTGLTTIGGVITNVGALNTTGAATTSINANVTTSGSQTYGNAALGGTAGGTVALTGPSVSLSGTLDGAGRNLTVSGGTLSVSQAVTGVGTLNASGATGASIGANITTTGSQNYGGTTTLSANANFQGTALTFNKIAAGAHSLGLRANAITVSSVAADAVTSTGAGTVTFEPLADNGTVAVAMTTPPVGALALSQSLLNKFSSFGTIAVGNAANPYTIAVGNLTLPKAMTLASSTGNITLGQVNGAHALSVDTAGTVAIDDVIGGTTALASLMINSTGNGTVRVDAARVRTSGDQTYGGPVELARDVQFETGNTQKAIFNDTVTGAHGLTVTGNATFNGDVTVSSVSVSRDTLINGVGITTTGDQTYGQAVTLAGATATVLTGDQVTFNGTVDGTVAGAQTLQINATTTDINGNIGATTSLHSLSVSGAANVGANVTTAQSQSWGGDITLDGNATLTAGTSVTVDGAINGAFALGVVSTGQTTLHGAVGAGTALASLTVTASGGTVINGGEVRTTGNQTFTGTVTLGADTTFSADVLTLNTALNAGVHDLTLRLGSQLVAPNAGSITGTGHVTLAGRNDTTAIVIGATTAEADLEIDAASLAAFGNGFSSLVIGSSTGQADITVANTLLSRNLSLRNGSGDILLSALEGNFHLTAQTSSGETVLGGDVGTFIPLASLTLTGPVRINASTVRTNGAQVYDGDVLLGSDVQISASTARFLGSVDSASALHHGLTVNTFGIISGALPYGTEFAGPIGQTQALSQLTVSGSAAAVNGSITTDVAQTWNSSVTLLGDTAFRAPSLTFNGDLTAGAHTLGLFSDNAPTPAGTLSGTGQVQVGAYNDATTIGLLGGTGTLQIDLARLNQLTNAGFTEITIGSTTGTGTITVGTSSVDNFVLTSNVTLQAGTGDIDVLSRINGAFALSVQTQGTTRLMGALGDETALASLTTDAGGTTRLGGASIRTTGNIDFNDAVRLDSDVRIDTAGRVRFDDTVDGATAGNEHLWVFGHAQFGGSVGGSTALESLYTSGTVRLEGATVHAQGFVQFIGAATLASNVSVSSDTNFTYFGSAIDGAHSLTINSGAEAYLLGHVGQNTPLTSVSVSATTTFLRGNITTTGSQSFGAVALEGDITLSGQAISLAAVDGARALSIDNSGLATLGGVIGGSTALTSLSTTGTTTIATGSINATTQQYGGPVTLTSNTTLSGTDVTFDGTVNGARALTVTASGVTTFNANVGGTTALTALTTNGGGSTVLPASVTTTGAQNYADQVSLSANTVLTANGVTLGALLGSSRSLQIDSSGLVDLNGTMTGLSSFSSTGAGTVRFDGQAGLSTTGSQSYAGDVIVSLDNAAFNGSSLTFSQDLTVANGLTLTANGLVLGGTVSGTGTVTVAQGSASTTIGLNGGTGTLSVDMSRLAGFSQVVIGRTDGTGAIRAGNLSLGRATVIQSGTGAITLADVDGAHTLAVNTTGVTTFGDVGATTALSSLSTNAGGSTVFTGQTVRTTGAQAYSDAVSYGSTGIAFTGTSLNFAAGLSGDASLTLTTNSLAVTGGLEGVGTLTIEGLSAGTTIGLADGAGTLQISNALLAQIDGFGTLVVGRTDGTGAINVGAVALTRNTTVRGNTAAITFQGPVDGAHALTVNTSGLTTFNGNVGATTALSSLSTGGGGNTRFAGTLVRTSGTQTHGDAVIYDTATFQGNHLAFTQGASGGTDLTFIANTLEVTGSLSGSGVLTIQPGQVSGTMGLAGGSGDLQVTQAMLDNISGFTQQVFGRTDGTGTIDAAALSLTGTTVLQSGTGDIQFDTIDGAHSLTVNTAGTTLFAGDIGGTTRLTSLTTDAAGDTSITADAVRTTTALTLADEVNVSGDILLDAGTAGAIALTNAANTFGGDVRLSADQVQLSAAGHLVLAQVDLVSGGSISASGTLTLAGDLNLTGAAGNLTLTAAATPSVGAFTDAELAERPRLALGLSLQENSATIRQTGGRLNTAAGSLLSLQATGGGSISVEQAGNTLQGQVSAVSTGSGDFSGTGTRGLSFVRLAAANVAVGGAGIEADAVKITADRLSTAAGTSIKARLPYNNAQGVESALPALTLVLSPTALGSSPLSKPFGGLAEADRIQVQVGDLTYGGFLTVRPKGGGGGNAFVSLGGPTTPRPFYDGSGKLTEVPVYYNGEVPQSPQEIGALSAVAAVIEESRRQRFEEAVRTENVSSRLRSGVIAEVGAGRPATEGSDSILMPPSCTPAGSSLTCQ